MIWASAIVCDARAVSVAKASELSDSGAGNRPASAGARAPGFCTGLFDSDRGTARLPEFAAQTASSLKGQPLPMAGQDDSYARGAASRYSAAESSARSSAG